MTMKKIVVILFVSLSMSVLANAEDNKDSFRIVFENDSFVQIISDRLRDTDRHYTNGFHMDLKINPNLGWLSFLSAGGEQFSGFLLGQKMYTPAELRDPNVNVNDQPYAGYVFLEYYEEYFQVGGDYTRFGLQVGCLGPCSRAEQTQKWVHDKKRGDGETPYNPEGWSHQIGTRRSEPGLQANFEYRFFWPYLTYEYFHLSPVLKGNIGNIFTDLGVGINTRIGLFEMNPAVEKEEFAFYLFGNLLRKRVFYNAVLQGGLYDRYVHDNEHSDHTIKRADMKRYVTTANVGEALTLWNITMKGYLGYMGTEFEINDNSKSDVNQEKDDFQMSEGAIDAGGPQYYIGTEVIISW